MAVHNGLSYLEASLASVKAQTFSDYEFVIIDDGSTDGTPGILRRAAAEDARLRVFRNETRQGLAASLNCGLSHARGEWIGRQDADDLSHPQRFARQLFALRDRPELALLGANGWLIDATGRRVGPINAPTGEVGTRWSLAFYNSFLHASVCFHREKVLALGGYNEAFPVAQDYELWIRLTSRWPADNLPDRLMKYRTHAGSATAASLGSDRDQLLDRLTGSALQSLGLGEFDTPENRQTIARLRHHFPPRDRPLFWKLHRAMKKAFLAGRIRQADLADAETHLHWKVAGALKNAPRLTILSEMAAAFLCSPGVFLRLVEDRLRGSKS